MIYSIVYLVGIVLVYYVLHFVLANKNINESYILAIGYAVGHIIGIIAYYLVYLGENNDN